MGKLGNKKLVMSLYDPNQTDEESHESYYQKTKWNDFNIGVPILFNFYHGLELCMKGLLQEINKLPTNKTHGLTDYYNLIQENETEFTPESIKDSCVEIKKRYLTLYIINYDGISLSEIASPVHCARITRIK